MNTNSQNSYNSNASNTNTNTNSQKLRKYNASNTKIKNSTRVEFYPIRKILYKNGKPADFILVDSEKPLSRGAFGYVYSACLDSKCEYVLKKIKSRYEYGRYEFLNEIKYHNKAADLGVTDPILLAYIINDNEFGYVFKRYRMSLTEHLTKLLKGKNEDAISDELVTICEAVKDILDTLKKHNIYQNDAHCDNFMFNSEGQLRIIDFGLASDYLAFIKKTSTMLYDEAIDGMIKIIKQSDKEKTIKSRYIQIINTFFNRTDLSTNNV